MSTRLNGGEQLAPRISVAVFLGALLTSTIFVYPRALIPLLPGIGEQAFFQLPFDVSLAAMALLALAALPVLMFLPWRLPRYLILALVVFAAMLLLNAPRQTEYLDEFLALMGCVSIPLAAAVLSGAGRITLKGLAAAATALWTLQILLASISLWNGQQPVGSAGNINWLAALLLMLSPWVHWQILQIGRRLLRHPLAAHGLALGLWLPPTLYVLYHCHSRAAWLALALLPLGWWAMRLKRIRYKLLLLAGVVLIGAGVLAVAYVWFPNALLRVVANDIRVPVWTGTAVMIAKQPLGGGSGEYQKDFTPLRRVSSYHQRLVAADMTNHPHNEALNLGTQLGLPALLAFLLMLAPIFRTTPGDPFQTCARISAFLVVLPAMFDLVLVQPPTSFLGYFVLGLCWPLKTAGSTSARSRRSTGTPVKMLISGLLYALALGIAGLDLNHDVHLRQGSLLQNQAYALSRAGSREEAEGVFEQAVERLKQAATPINSLIPYYKIGRISLELSGGTAQAEDYIGRVTALDANFSHINLLSGRLKLRQGDLAGAEAFFIRECSYYPRGEKAWQNLYAFSANLAQYERNLAIEDRLTAIYQERARQNLPAARFDVQARALDRAIAQNQTVQALALAGGLLNRIHYRIVDPLFRPMTTGLEWPPDFLTGEFNEIDVADWRFRRDGYRTMREALGDAPVPPREFVRWFSGYIRLEPDSTRDLPVQVWSARAGSATGRYLLLSQLAELNGSRSILKLDSQGRPQSAYLLWGSAREPAFCEVDFPAADCRPVDPERFRGGFRWQPGQTSVFFPVEDFLLRNQVLGAVVGGKLPYLQRRPPFGRMVELMAVTPRSPLPASVEQLARYSYPHLAAYYQQNLRLVPRTTPD